MILVSDIGNTNIVFALFDSNSELQKIFRLSTQKNRTSDEFASDIFIQLSILGVKLDEIEGGLISSVVPSITESISICFRKLFKIKPHIFTYNSNSGLNIVYKTPETLGVDRLVNCAYIWKYYKKASIIIDAGTATTVDIVIDGNYIGGMITPGLLLMRDSLFFNTASLPSIPIKYSDSVIGKTTVESIQTGVINGYIHLLRGLINDIKNEYPNVEFDIWLTGGFSNFLKERFIDIKSDIDLTLKGLNYLFYRNLE